MFGTFAATSFELEAERRREVLAASMRDARRRGRVVDDGSHEMDRWIEASERRRIAGISAIVSLLGRVGPRA